MQKTGHYYSQPMYATQGTASIIPTSNRRNSTKTGQRVEHYSFPKLVSSTGATPPSAQIIGTHVAIDDFAARDLMSEPVNTRQDDCTVQLQ